MQRIVIDLAWGVAVVFVSAVILRELSIVAKPYAPNLVTRPIEFAIGTGGVGAGTAG